MTQMKLVKVAEVEKYTCINICEILRLAEPGLQVKVCGFPSTQYSLCSFYFGIKNKGKTTAKEAQM